MHPILLLLCLLLGCSFAEAQVTSGARWVTPAVTAPRVEFRTFDSKAAKTKVSFHIFTPEVYDSDKEGRFPVLYWLHGTGGGLSGIAPLSAFFGRAMRDGKIPPMLIVFPNGFAASKIGRAHV